MYKKMILHICAWLLCLATIFPLTKANAADFSSSQNEAQLTLTPIYVAFSQSTRFLEQRYLREARRYRREGRYELARQSYALALSICSNEKRIAIIRQELDGMDLLLRTLR
ncbi:MAG: hypothetical protein IJT59_01050 [Desulfovibrionaceae bacterium]|nr:hypothetical protein [Desulfovibrionaceae bacterium]